MTPVPQHSPLGNAGPSAQLRELQRQTPQALTQDPSICHPAWQPSVSSPWPFSWQRGSHQQGRNRWSWRATFRRWGPSGCWGTCASRSRASMFTHDFCFRPHRFQLIFSPFGWDVIKGRRTGWSRLWGWKLHNIHGLCLNILRCSRWSCMVIQGDPFDLHRNIDENR